jgi:hypothetical protein
MHPSQRLQIIQEIMLWESCWKINLLMGSPLWWHANATDFLHLWVVRGAYTIQVTSNLCPQICYADKLLQNVLWHDISISSFLHYQVTMSTNINIYDYQI